MMPIPPHLAFASRSLVEETARCQNGGVMYRRIANREEVVMSQATIAPPEIKTLADLRTAGWRRARANLVPPCAWHRDREGRDRG